MRRQCLKAARRAAILACMKQVTLPSGETVAALGQGTWNMGDDPDRRQEEIATLRLGIDLGLTLIDTAEMYGDGRSETLVGEAIEGRRDEVFVVTKVLPHNASRRAMHVACNNGLQRLRIDVIDLYLLHWPGAVPIDETVRSFQELQRDGKIRHWGVSNCHAKLMQALRNLPGGADVQTNQVLYNLTRRGIEWDLLPWQREHHVSVMAYSPVEQGRLLRKRGLAEFAKQHAMTPAQVSLAWLLAHDDVIAIPKASRREHVRDNAQALEHPLTKAHLRELDSLFPPPKGPGPLEMI
jgi:diketogulonate reductase-like aldo/keto reductase